MNNYCFQHHRSLHVSQLGTAGRKLLAIFVYVMGTYVVYTASTIVLRMKYDRYIETVLLYFACESDGGQNCDRSDLDRESMFLIVLAPSGLVLSLYPTAALLFALNFQEVKQFFLIRKRPADGQQQIQAAVPTCTTQDAP